MTYYPRLFAPFTLGSRTAPNRIVSTSHATAYDADGLITERLIDYEARKAEGGAGIVSVFGSASVDPDSVASFGSVRLWDSANDEALTRLAERVHSAGALILTQATHMGRRGNTMKRGVLSAPSAVPEPLHREIPHALTTPEIERIIERFAEAAARLERCGFDGIELQGGGGQLIEQFFGVATNQRTDRFGGNLEDRTRFAAEVVQAISGAVSDGFIIGIKLSGDPSTTDYGLTPEDMRAVAKHLDGLGRLNFFNVAGSPAATHKSTARSIPSAYMPLGTNVDLAREMRNVVSTPILVAGRILEPEQAEQVLAEGGADLIGMTRAIIADPDLPRRSKRGEFHEVRPCISINEGCIGRLYQGLEVRCVVNPAIAHPELATIEAASDPKRVVVVGAGPAGLEAARSAAARGHSTVLVEAATTIGGQLRYAQQVEDSPRYQQYLDWVARQLEAHHVEIRLETVIDRGLLTKLEPDSVIIATGADDYVPAAMTHPVVATDVDLYRGTASNSTGRVLVYDVEGHGRGPQAARWLKSAGATSVALATDLMHVSELIDPTQVAPVYSRLAEAGVRLLPNMSLGQDGSALVEQWTEEEVPLERFDMVVTVGFRRVRNHAAIELDDGPWSLDVIGDAFAPRRLADAVLEGVRAGAVNGQLR